ncbi:cyclase family protein [Sulfuriflexus mobilis]|uniref:cyclase family protein n=1 Tax=Sulfuriflexus mobilis TaxID=1811807 RepID=UPI000F8399A0|nr:cyclase family protein [Sulfuriflexus mobilis]
MFNTALHTVSATLLVVSFFTGLANASDNDDRENKAWIHSISTAQTFDLSHTWDENSPVASVNPPFSMSLNATHESTRGIFGDGGQLSFTSEIMQWSGQHGAPSIDAIGHIGRDGHLFGAVDAAAATSDLRGLGRSGIGAELDIDHFPRDLLANRAVLLDVARFINNDDTPLAADFEITAAHLEQTAKAQKVRIKPGDTVFIRTGWGQYFRDNPQLYLADEAAGLGVGAAQYLVDKGARVVGNDTLTFEKRPPLIFEPRFQVFPVHMLLLADHGIYIIENLLLEELAAEKVYTFIAVVPPLKIRGGTGSALRVFALAAEDKSDH